MFSFPKNNADPFKKQKYQFFLIKSLNDLFKLAYFQSKEDYPK
jgi:hypothetical protein